MTFAWETDVFKQAVQDMGFARDQTNHDNLDSWVWAVVDDIFGGSYYLLPSGVNLPAVDVPMGTQAATVPSTGGHLPSVGGPTVLDQTPALPPTPTQYQTPSEVSDMTFGDYLTWDDFLAAGHTRPGDWDVYRNPADYVAGIQKPAYKTVAPTIPAGPTGAGAQTPDPGAIPMWDDFLPDWGDLIDIIFDQDEGTPTPNTPTVPSTPRQPPVVYPAPPGTQVPGRPASPYGPGVYVDANGQLRCKRRRRRKRLATTTDIRDLAALKATIGGGEAFKAWIATHPSY